MENNSTLNKVEAIGLSTFNNSLLVGGLKTSPEYKRFNVCESASFLSFFDPLKNGLMMSVISGGKRRTFSPFAIDSFQLHISADDCSFIHPCLKDTLTHSVYYTDSGEIYDQIDEVMTCDKTGKLTYNALLPLKDKLPVSLNFQYKYYENFQGRGYTISIAINSKLLGVDYFTGITIDNIESIYDLIVDTGLINLSFTQFMNSNVFDVDVKCDYLAPKDFDMSSYTKSLESFLLPEYRSEDMHKRFNAPKSTGLGFQIGKRDSKKNPFLKVYSKTAEFSNGSKSEEMDKFYSGVNLFNYIGCNILSEYHYIRHELTIRSRSMATALGIVTKSERFTLASVMQMLHQDRCSSLFDSVYKRYFLIPSSDISFLDIHDYDNIELPKRKNLRQSTAMIIYKSCISLLDLLHVVDSDYNTDRYTALFKNALIIVDSDSETTIKEASLIVERAIYNYDLHLTLLSEKVDRFLQPFE